MSELCKDCKKEMKFISKEDDYGYTIWIYECHNEDCNTQPKKVINVCNNCEHESIWWED